MTDPAKDFRYTSPDGDEVEGYQLTDATRYQEKSWPAWLNPRDFMTVDGAQWITIDGEEMPIPELAWMVKLASGRLTIVDPFAFENYVKVVPLAVEVFEPPETVGIVVPPEMQSDELLLEVKVVFEMLMMGQIVDAIEGLTTAISSRTNWCKCPPGQCEGLQLWSCREKSPLVRGRPDGQ